MAKYTVRTRTRFAGGWLLMRFRSISSCSACGRSTLCTQASRSAAHGRLCGLQNSRSVVPRAQLAQCRGDDERKRRRRYLAFV
jgi:hypothetical protein